MITHQDMAEATAAIADGTAIDIIEAFFGYLEAAESHPAMLVEAGVLNSHGELAGALFYLTQMYIDLATNVGLDPRSVTAHIRDLLE